MGMSRVTSVVLSAGLLGFVVLAGGCQQKQMRRMQVETSPSDTQVFEAAAAVLKERYYQVKLHRASNHLIALDSPQLEGNNPVRNRIDVRIELENGFYVPKVLVTRYIDTSEPPYERGGPLTARFPIEVNDHPAGVEDYDPLMYDQSLAMDLRNAIISRLTSKPSV